MHSAPQSSLTGKTDRQLQSGQDHRFGEEAFSAIDRMREAASAKFTGGLSPTSLMLAYLDWAIHLAGAPGKQLELASKAVRKASRLGAHAISCLSAPDAAPCIEPLPGDRRFAAPEWRTPPFNLMAQAFLLKDVGGVGRIDRLQAGHPEPAQSGAGGVFGKLAGDHGRVPLDQGASGGGGEYRF